MGRFPRFGKKRWFAILLLAALGVWQIFLQPIWNINVERWAEQRKLDTQLRDVSDSSEIGDQIMNILAPIVDFITGPFGLGFIIGALVLAFWDPVARLLFSKSGQSEGVQTSEAVMAQSPERAENIVQASQHESSDTFPDHIVPVPIFGHPQQQAREPYLSWWHIPIDVHGDGGSPSPEILYCRVEMVSANPTDAELPLSLRWQQDNEPRGVERITLVQGIPRVVPVAIRCETGREVAEHHQAIADGIARYTGAAYLRDGNIDKFQLSPSFNQFRLRIHSAARTFLSPIYMLRVPAPDDSNGSFILDMRDGT